MNVTYRDTADSGTTPATAVDAQAGADDDREIKKIIIGKPVASASLVLYTINNAYFGATTNIALKISFPSTLATGENVTVIDLTSPEYGGSPSGLILSGGGSFTTSSAMQVSILWDLPET